MLTVKSRYWDLTLDVGNIEASPLFYSSPYIIFGNCKAIAGRAEIFASIGLFPVNVKFTVAEYNSLFAP